MIQLHLCSPYILVVLLRALFCQYVIPIMSTAMSAMQSGTILITRLALEKD